MRLRPFQQKAVDEIAHLYTNGATAVCYVAPTGSGKTATASEIIRRAVVAGYRVVFAAHLDTILDDTAARIRHDIGIACGVVQADRARDETAEVQVASTATLAARKETPRADLFILDECQRVNSPGVRETLARYPHVRLLGLTATPQRGDGKPLGDVFKHLVMGPSVTELQAMGFLVPIDVVAWSHVYQEHGLSVSPVDACLWANEWPAIVFASGVDHARAIVAEFVAKGKTAELYIGETSRDERLYRRARLRAGQLDALVTVNALVEGFDEASIRCVCLARAFSVYGPYMQAIGRGARISPDTGKQRCTVLDLRSAYLLHGLPDEPVKWSLEGKAVTRLEAAVKIQRCKECGAVFRPSTSCPRCGARVTRSTPREVKIMSRAEKAEVVSALPQKQRDLRYLYQKVHVARSRLRLSESASHDWALRQFKKQFGRMPETE